MTFQIDQSDGRAGVVRVRGDLDMATVPAFIAAVEDQLSAGAHVHVDLAHVDFIDSVAVNAFFRLVKAADADGNSLTFQNPSRAVRHVLTIAGVFDVLPIAGNGDGDEP